VSAISAYGNTNTYGWDTPIRKHQSLPERC